MDRNEVMGNYLKKFNSQNNSNGRIVVEKNGKKNIK